MSYRAMIARCSQARLRALLTVGSGEPEDPAPAGMPSRRELERLGRSLDGESFATLRAILAGAGRGRIPLARLRELKDSAKRLREQSAEGEWRRGATLLYHLAGAAAWTLHGAHISARSPQARGTLYAELADELGDEDLARLFSDASREIRECEPGR